MSSINPSPLCKLFTALKFQGFCPHKRGSSSFSRGLISLGLQGSTAVVGTIDSDLEPNIGFCTVQHEKV